MKKILEKIKLWAVKTALPWLKAGAMQIVNMIVLFIAYSGFDEAAQPGYSFAIGIWLFALGVFYIAKLFGFDKVIKSYFDQKKKVNKKK